MGGHLDGLRCTGFSSEMGTKLRDWAIGQAGGSCYSQAALSSNDSKTRYIQVSMFQILPHRRACLRVTGGS